MVLYMFIELHNNKNVRNYSYNEAKISPTVLQDCPC